MGQCSQGLLADHLYSVSGMILLDEDGVTVQNRSLGRTEEQGQWQTSAT